jgi:hypothetical protein
MSFWGATEFQVRLRQIRRSLPQDIVLLFKETVPATQLAHLSRFVGRLTGTSAFLDIGLAQPVLQRRFADTEVNGDLLERDTALAAASNRDDVLAELSGIGTGHDDILPASAIRH